MTSARDPRDKAPTTEKQKIFFRCPMDGEAPTEVWKEGSMLWFKCGTCGTHYPGPARNRTFGPDPRRQMPR